MPAKMELSGVCKSFGGIHALKNVDLTLRPGEVHALLGANGAGKSTLIKIITGIHTMDSGEMRIAGNKVRLSDPAEAKRHGIAAIYQELSLIDELSVAQNLFLGREPVGSLLGVINRRELDRRCAECLSEFQVDLSPSAKVGGLGMGAKRVLEILKALTLHAEILLLDEPSTGMSRAEIDTLFTIMRRLRETDVTMIFISHNLEEVRRICDRATVLRDGENHGTFDIAEADTQTLVRAMIGHDVKSSTPPAARSGKRVLLETVEYHTGAMRAPVSIRLREGEILGVTGIVGAGKSELARSLFGLEGDGEGEYRLAGKAGPPGSAADPVGSRLALIPEDRKSQGLFLNQTVERNMTVVQLRKMLRFGMMVDGRQSRAVSRDMGERLSLKPLRIDMAAQNFSGGNQQKVVVGKWLLTDPDIIFMDEPTRGIDIGAKEDIYSLIREMTAGDKGVIIFSSEFEELLALCHRIIVLRNGAVASSFEGSEATLEKLMVSALGGR